MQIFQFGVQKVILKKLGEKCFSYTTIFMQSLVFKVNFNEENKKYLLYKVHLSRCRSKKVNMTEIDIF